jgi:hypothetical protein
MMFGEWAVTAVRRADTHEKSHFKALPVAIDVVKAVLTQPTELRLDIEQAVGGIFVLERLVDRRKNAMCRRWVARRHMLKVRKYPARFEQIEDLAIQRAFSLVLEMVDGH